MEQHPTFYVSTKKADGTFGFESCVVDRDEQSLAFPVGLE